MTRAVIRMLAGTIAFAGAASAQSPNIYEGFDIPFQQDVGPGAGSSGFGWLGDWAVSVDGPETTPPFTAVGPEGLGQFGSWGPDQDGTDPENLDFGGYTSGGFTTGRSIRRSSGAGIGVITRLLDPAALSAGLVEGGELWFSVLVEVPATVANFGLLIGAEGFEPATLQPADTGDDRGFGFQIRAGQPDLIARGWQGGGFLGAGPGLPLAGADELLVIVRYQFVAGLDTLTVYTLTESDVGATLSSLPTSVFEVAMDPADFVVVSGYDAANTRFDEIRISAVGPGGDVQAALDDVAPGMNLDSETTFSGANVYEPFDIDFQQPVGGPDGSSGFGWAGDWSFASADGGVAPEGAGTSGSWGDDQDGMAPDNLDFSGYTSSGATAGRSIRRTSGAGAGVITRVLDPDVLASVRSDDAGEIWLSVLLETPSSNGGFGFLLGDTGFNPVTSQPFDDAGTGEDDRGFGFQIQGNTGELFARGWKGDGFIGGGEPRLVPGRGAELLVIVRYQLNAGGEDTLTVYLATENDDGRELSQLPSSIYNVFINADDLQLISINDPSQHRLDEIRVAVLADGQSPQVSLDAVAPGMGLSLGLADTGIYEPFDIPFQQAVGGPDGSSGFGWSGDWAVTLSPDASAGPAGTGASGSFGPDQDGMGADNFDFAGYTSGGFTDGRSVRRSPAAGESASTRAFASDAIANGLAEGAEIWGSLLVQYTGFNSQFGLGLGATAFDPDARVPLGTDADRMFGFDIFTSGGVNSLRARGWKGGGFIGGGSPTIPVAFGEEMLIVFRMEIVGGQDTLTVWKVGENDSGSFLSSLPNSVLTAAIDPSLFSVVAQFETGNAFWDELRIVSVPVGGDPEAALDVVAPGMDLDIEPLPVLSFTDDAADVYEPFAMPTGVPVDKQGSGKGWGEIGTDASTASRWVTTTIGGEQVVLDGANDLPSLFGTPELVFNGTAAQRDDTSGASSITRMIDPLLADDLFQEGGETWVSLVLDLNERDGGLTSLVSANNTAVVFANAPYGPEGFGDLPVGGADTFGDFTGFGFRVTGTVEGTDTIIRPTTFFDGWKEGSDEFPPTDPTSTDWFSGDSILVVMRAQWQRVSDGIPVDGNADDVPDGGTTDVFTLWRLIPGEGLGSATTNLDTFSNQENIQGTRYFDEQDGGNVDPSEFEFPFGQVAIRNEQINMVSIAQNLTAAVDELRISYVRFGETSQDALDRVTPGLGLTVSNTANPPAPPCNDFDLDGDGDNDGDDLAIFLAGPMDLNMDGETDAFDNAVYLDETSAIDPNCGE
ncbi:MAG: hypothetical protein AAGI30_08905 [Planctomycetota bacterium]